VVEGRTGPGRRDLRIEPLKADEDWLRLDVGKRGMYEWWYFDAPLDSGHTVVVLFYASNINPGREGKIGVEVILLRPDGIESKNFSPIKNRILLSPGTGPK
jgi:hypothetical protein